MRKCEKKKNYKWKIWKNMSLKLNFEAYKNVWFQWIRPTVLSAGILENNSPSLVYIIITARTVEQAKCCLKLLKCVRDMWYHCVQYRLINLLTVRDEFKQSVSKITFNDQRFPRFLSITYKDHGTSLGKAGEYIYIYIYVSSKKQCEYNAKLFCVCVLNS